MNESRRKRLVWLLSTAALVLLAAGCGLFNRRPLVPELPTAQDQYLFAYQQKEDLKHRLIEKSEMDEEYRKIIYAYQQVIDRFPDDERFTPLAWLSQAELYDRMDEDKEAVEHYDVVLERYQDDDVLQAAALLGEGRALIDMHRFEEGRLVLMRCVDTYKDNPDKNIQYYIAECKHEMNMLRQNF